MSGNGPEKFMPRETTPPPRPSSDTRSASHYWLLNPQLVAQEQKNRAEEQEELLLKTIAGDASQHQSYIPDLSQTAKHNLSETTRNFDPTPPKKIKSSQDLHSQEEIIKPEAPNLNASSLHLFPNKDIKSAKDLIKDITIKCVTEKNMNELLKYLHSEYTSYEHKEIIKSHLTELYPLNQEKEYSSEDYNLQIAFAIMRGIDSYNRFQQTKPFSKDQIKERIEMYEKRYDTHYEEEGDYDEVIGPRVCTTIKDGEEEQEPCYTNQIALESKSELDGSTTVHGTIDLLGNYKKRPNVLEPETLVFEDEDEVNDFYDNDRELAGTKPLFHSIIIWNQIRFKVEKRGLEMSQFKLSSPLSEYEVINQETVRTLNLFMKPGESKKFKKGEHGYFAALGTPLGKGKLFLLGEYFPHLEISEIRVNEVNSQRIAFIEYIITIKGSQHFSPPFSPLRK